MSPRRADVERRDGKVWVYLTSGEHTQLREAARAADLTISAYVRVIIKAALAWNRGDDQPAAAFGLRPMFPVELPRTVSDPFANVARDVLHHTADWGDYPAPHYDEYDVCKCPDHVALREGR